LLYRRIAFAAPFAFALLTGCATQQPQVGHMVRAKGYPGSERPEKDVAVIFATDARPRWDVTFICTVDGRALERPGCANVVYVSPGTHTLGWQYQGTNATGRGEIASVFEAGRLYQLNASSLGGSRGVVQVIPMSPNTPLTYRNVSPSQVPQGAKPDDPIPYGIN
jgi:hypothetical protein